MDFYAFLDEPEIEEPDPNPVIIPKKKICIIQ